MPADANEAHRLGALAGDGGEHSALGGAVELKVTTRPLTWIALSKAPDLLQGVLADVGVEHQGASGGRSGPLSG